MTIRDRPKRRRGGEFVSGMYFALPHVVLDSVAYQLANYAAKALLLELGRQHNGRDNNGRLHLSQGWLVQRGWNSRDTIQRAKDELLARHLIVETRKGGFNRGPSLFALTWLPISNFVGLDMLPADYRPGAYASLNGSPKKKPSRPIIGTDCTDDRGKAAPMAGMAKAVAAPITGSKTADLEPSAAPIAGHNSMYCHSPLTLPSLELISETGSSAETLQG
jgi:hypothetical protein